MAEKRLGVDRLFRLPRAWSNRELEKMAHLFYGDVVNVSAWKDEDKEGRRYRDYFINAASYWVTNWRSEARGFQNYPNEIFLDLEQELALELVGRFDVVFNHTTLEHVFNVFKAFENLCLLSRDIVMVCVPFLQPYHTDYGDFWRFSPMAVKRLYEANGLHVLYINWNRHRMSSVYVFAVGSKNPGRWQGRFPESPALDERLWHPGEGIGYSALPNMWHRLVKTPKRWWKKLYPGS
uniref:Methyltransferase domain-containing protein n=1 Tax=Desulfacinum infernum TaxID=35837 RepID=A0A832A020_9BACT